MRIDIIAKRLLQTERFGATEAVLAANPGLATIMVFGLVPEGVAVYPPADWTPTSTASLILPWE
nr:tail protein X [Shinella yambaruensis]